MSDHQDDRPESRADVTPNPSAPATPLAPPLPQAQSAGAVPSVPPVPPILPVHGTAAPAAQPVYGQYAAPAAHTPHAGPAAHAAQAAAAAPTPPSPPTPPGGGQSFGAAASQPPQASGQRKGGAGRVVGLLVAAALVGGAAGLGGAYAGTQLWPTPAATGEASGPSVVTVNDPDSVNATTAIAAKAVPSVVTIEAASDNGAGTGSGVILTEDGYIVTNTHVVTLGGATDDAQLRVTTSDGHVYEAKVVGTDPLYDLAVIKLVDAKGLQPIEFAKSSELNVGDQTVAVGAPLGLSNSVTTGIVSALNRSIEIASSAVPDHGDDQGDSGDQKQEGEGEDGPFYFDFGDEQQPQQPTDLIKIAVIQTDAAINHGNSGGALVDSEGKLIGINVAIAGAGSSDAQSGNIGVGFSIPSDVVKRISDELRENGEATHGLLGASVQSAAFVKGSNITGAYIAEISPGGAAEAAGLKKGDTVTGFNGLPITDSVDLTAQVRAAAAGSDATVTYVRDGQSHTVDVTLGGLSD